jgi:hypothetical protein
MTAPEPVHIHADHDTVKRLGHWTTARKFELRARHSRLESGLRSPGIEDGDIDMAAELDNSVLILLVPEDAVIDQTQLRWTGRGRVRDVADRPANSGQAIHLTGHVRRGEVRVRRGGAAILAAMFSREYAEDVRRAHRIGTVPTVDAPARTGGAGR